MEAAPTWIDAGLAREWQSGRPARYDLTGRWFVFLDDSSTAFMAMSGNAGHGSFGGEDIGYTAEQIASAIERFGSPVAGLKACPAFFEALEHDVQRVEAKGTRLEIIRANVDATRARAAIAHAEDAPPFTGVAQRHPAAEADAATLIIPWEAGYDS